MRAPGATAIIETVMTVVVPPTSPRSDTDPPGPGARLSGRRPILGRIVALVALRAGWCNADIAAAWWELGIDASLLPPAAAIRRVRAGDVVVNRLDVRASLDGVEPGLSEVSALARSGAVVVNAPDALVAAHDKLATARRLAAAGIPHPGTVHVPPGAGDVSGVTPPLVLKPRFGSWGSDVMLCRSRDEVESALAFANGRPWFRRQGAVAQPYIPHAADLRLVVARGRLIGAIERRPARGEWRTNFSLGGSRRPVVPAADAVRVARAATDALGAEFVGVDLLAVPDGYVVLEINASVDFDRLYSLPGRDAYRDLAAALELPVPHAHRRGHVLVPRGRAEWLPATSWRSARWA
jgi:tetrahydromethanopterin:alpha-L-glutamate ligase